ncbi:MAG: transposase, partial [Elusimicrobia bacterium]|nr:transposase [Elusimicrobiota bacterium]
MPRQPRLDAPGLLQHVLARGIERRAIFRDKTDYQDFLSRLESSLEKSPNHILAWALMPNHFHLLIRS